MMIRRLLWVVGTLVVLACGCFGAGVYWVSVQTPLWSEYPVEVSVPQGTTPTTLVKVLQSQDVRIQFRFPWVFEVATRAFFLRGRILKAGHYVVSPEETYWTWLERFQRGIPRLVRVTIPEGLTYREIAQRFVEAGILMDDDPFLSLAENRDFLSRLQISAPDVEGYLFPSTYKFPKKYSAMKLMIDLIETYWERVAPKGFRVAHPYLSDHHQYLILASVVEKETGLASERARIAGVFHNRLRKGMRLESDPTTIYGLADFDGDLKRSHLLTRTPYNTYMMKGLPRGPICNPGLSAIEAAYHPEKHGFLFFVSKNDGSHVFSENFKTHTTFVDRYQRSRRRGKTSDN